MEQQAQSNESQQGGATLKQVKKKKNGDKYKFQAVLNDSVAHWTQVLSFIEQGNAAEAFQYGRRDNFVRAYKWDKKLPTADKDLQKIIDSGLSDKREKLQLKTAVLLYSLAKNGSQLHYQQIKKLAAKEGSLQNNASSYLKNLEKSQY